MNNPVIMHINYCEQGQSLKEIFQVATDIGYDGVEFRRYKPGYAETPEQYWETIAKLREDYKLPYVFFGGPGIEVMTQDQDAIDQNLADYMHFLDVADEYGLLSTINFMTGTVRNPDVPLDLAHCEDHGYACKTDWQWENAIKACRIIADYKPHVKFAFETHMYYLHDTAKTTRELVDAIDRPNFGINLDYGNALFFPHTESLEEAIRISGDKLFYTHLKSYQPIGSGAGQLLPTSLADGCINHRQYIKELKKLGFEGPIGIEAPRPGDREYFAAQDFNYIQPLIRKF